ncbi:DUF362 domain-containing protein [Candidatus Poribacteria bacterium]|nr:DUF362 domain-containing protein [Candidatus Poribacteria bacterium]
MEKIAIKKIRNGNISEAIESAIELIGGLERFISQGDKVLIKPNLTTDKSHEFGVTTNPNVVEAIVYLARRAGAKDIVIGEGTMVGLNTADVFEALGYCDLAKRIGVSLVDLNTDEMKVVKIPNPRVIDSIHVPKTYLQSDVVVNVPLLKTHICAVATLSLKNMKGVIPQSDKRRLHALGVNDGIVDINKVLKQHLIIVDGVRGQEGLGPISGTPVDMNLIIAGTNPVSVDAVCAKIMDINPRNVLHIRGAAEAGLGTLDLRRMRICGEKIADVKRKFIKPPRQLRGVFDGIEPYVDGSACSGCVGAIGVALARMRDAGELRMIAEKFGKISLVAGHNTPTSVDRKNFCVTIGNCQAKQKGQLHIPDCPPSGFSIRDRIRNLLGLESLY